MQAAITGNINAIKIDKWNTNENDNETVRGLSLRTWIMLLFPTALRDWSEVYQTRMKLSGDSGEHWHASWRDLSTHLPWQPMVLAAARTTQRVSLCSTPWPRHRPPSRRRIASDWHSTHTSVPFIRRLGQSVVTLSTSFFSLPADALVHDRRTAVSSNCIQYLRTHAADAHDHRK